jgi:hypothetical protein
MKARAASLLNLTEDRVLQNLSSIAPLTVSLRPYETVTLRVEFEPDPESK